MIQLFSAQIEAMAKYQRKNFLPKKHNIVVGLIPIEIFKSSIPELNRLKESFLQGGSVLVNICTLSYSCCAAMYNSFVIQ